MVLAHCRVMVLVFAGSQSIAWMMFCYPRMYGYGYALLMVWCQGYPMVQVQGQGSRILQNYGFGVCRDLACRWEDVRSFIVWLWLYFIHGLVSETSHGLGLGLWFSHVLELQLWCLQGRCWDDVTSFIISGCTIIVILYSWSGVRGIPWSRVRVRVVAYCRVMVLVFARSQSVAGQMLEVLQSQEIRL